MTDLSAIAGLADQKQKVEQYRSLLTSLVGANDVEGLKGFTDHSAQPSSMLSVLCMPMSRTSARAWPVSCAPTLPLNQVCSTVVRSTTPEQGQTFPPLSARS